MKRPLRSGLRAAFVLASASALMAGLTSGETGGKDLAGARRATIPAATIRPLISFLPLRATSTVLPTTTQCRQLFGISCYTPAQLARVYEVDDLRAVGIDGRGTTIALVDPFGSPTIAQDLKAFDRQFGLPGPPHFKVIQPAGPVPPFDPTDPMQLTWAGEATLDVEWSHAMAPGANILLVETPVPETEGAQGFLEIVAAENYVINHHLADVISQSFGATEETFSSPSALLALRRAFQNAAAHGVTVLAAAGDTGATGPQLDQTDLYTSPVVEWPSSDPLVTSVGGTQLDLDNAGNRLAPDAVWNDTTGILGPPGAGGGGVSAVFSRPGFQGGERSVVGDHRGTPDVSMAAGPVWVSTSYPPLGPGISPVEGNSVAAPLFAGIVALADQLGGHDLGPINQALYQLPRGVMVDITAGNNSFGPFTNSNGQTYTVAGYQAVPGYDLASGLGTVDAALLVPALAR